MPQRVERSLLGTRSATGRSGLD